MRRFDLVASKEVHSNFTLRGSGDVYDLPCTKIAYQDGASAVASTWRVPLWQRIKFLFDGRIHAVVFSQTHPPLCIQIGDLFK